MRIGRAQVLTLVAGGCLALGASSAGAGRGRFSAGRR